MAKDSIKYDVQLTTLGVPVEGNGDNSTIELQEVKVNPFEASNEQVLKTLNTSKNSSFALFGSNPILTKEVNLENEIAQLNAQNSTSLGNIALNGFRGLLGGLKNVYETVNRYNNAIDGKKTADYILPSYSDLEAAFNSNPRALCLANQVHALYYN